MTQIKISGNHWRSLMSVHCFQMFLAIEDKYIYFDDCGSSPRALTLGVTWQKYSFYQSRVQTQARFFR